MMKVKRTAESLPKNLKLKITSDKEENETAFCLKGNGVCLKPFGINELYSEEYLEWMNDVEITRTIGRFDYLMPVSRAILVDYYKKLDKETTLFFAIYSTFSRNRLKGNSKFIGTLKIYDLDKLARRASIGIVIGDKLHWGKGRATSAIRIATRYIFEVLGFRKITAGYLSGNIGIEKAFLKNDFKKEAVFKEQCYLAGKLVDHIFVSKFDRTE